jgi:hypothetical protein
MSLLHHLKIKFDDIDLQIKNIKEVLIVIAGDCNVSNETISKITDVEKE